MADPGIQALAESLSVRSFVDQLSAHLTSSHPPPAVFIHAPTNIELVTPLVQHILLEADVARRRAESSATPPAVTDLLPRVATIDLSVVHSTRQAFDRVLNHLSGWTAATDADAWDDSRRAVINWDGRLDGLGLVKRKRKSNATITEQRASKRRKTQTTGAFDDDDPFIVRDNREPADYDEDDCDDYALQEADAGGIWQIRWDRSLMPVKDEVGPLRESVEHFQVGLRKVACLGRSDANPEQPETFDRRHRFVIFDSAERLPELPTGGQRDTGLGSTFVATMLRLREISRVNLTTVFVSQLGFVKFSDGQVGVTEPICLTFPDINDCGPSRSQVDSVNILAARFAATLPTSDKLSPEQLVELFRSLAGLIWSTYGSLSTDLDSLAYMTAKFWPKWLDCVENSNPPIAPTNIAALQQAIKDDLTRERDLVAGTRPSLDPVTPSKTPSRKYAAAETRVLHGFAGTIPDLPRGPTFLADPDSPSTSAAIDTFGSPVRPVSLTPLTPLKQRAAMLTPENSPTKKRQQHVTDKAKQSLAKTLPVVSRFLLVAAYYASYNPAKSDVKHFVKMDENVAKKGKKARRSPKKSSVSAKAKMTLEIGGGKAFPLERLIAIYETIVHGDYTPIKIRSIDVQLQIATLINLRLLARVSGVDKLMDGVKLRSKINKDVADVLAQSIGLGQTWREYLWDPEG
ncbi:hypothetical protein OIV83_001630 [Microbotryomycetes sp. JL201]|nr:hypothetical protein OIV83_001630 [Microbotryomycetes sp. JL201]